MNTITVPINFESVSLLNKFYSEFEQQAVGICKKYGVEEIWDNAKILKDEQELTLAIVSLGSVVKGSNAEKAANEIITTFNKNFN